MVIKKMKKNLMLEPVFKPEASRGWRLFRNVYKRNYAITDYLPLDMFDTILSSELDLLDLLARCAGVAVAVLAALAVLLTAF